MNHVAFVGSTNVGIHYSTEGERDNKGLIGYGDSDWASDPVSRRNVIGYLLLFTGTPAAWKSKFPGAVTTSTSEAEWDKTRKIYQRNPGEAQRITRG
ncbi:unnamed protein product [Choristocarpus tenellus]